MVDPACKGLETTVFHRYRKALRDIKKRYGNPHDTKMAVDAMDQGSIVRGMPSLKSTEGHASPLL